MAKYIRELYSTDESEKSNVIVKKGQWKSRLDVVSIVLLTLI